MALKIEEGLLPARRDGSLSIFISGAEVRAYPCTQGWFLAEIFCRARFSGFSLHAGMVPWRLSWTKSHWLRPARRDGSRQEIFVAALDQASPCTQGWFSIDRKGIWHIAGFALHAGMVLFSTI